MNFIKIGILSVGNEIVKGRTVNTNAALIGRFFTSLGHEISYVLSCRDKAEDIGLCLDFLVPMCEIIITTGGLGPTIDDITIESISKHFRIELSLNKEAFAALSVKFKEENVELTKERIKMAMMPEGCGTLANNVGTAPGMILHLSNNIIFSIPGVPEEMKSMLPEISKFIEPSGMEYYSIEYGIQGVKESTLAPNVKRILKKFNHEMEIKTHPQSREVPNQEIIIEIYGYGKSRIRLENIAEQIKKELDDVIAEEH